MNLPFMPEAKVERAAIIDPTGQYRYTLTRSFPSDRREGMVNWIMLNPSTADACQDDATIRRCIDYSKRWGYERLVVTNLFAFRATDPAVMKISKDPVGPENDIYLRVTMRDSSLVMIAWGNHGTFRGRADEVFEMIAESGRTPHALDVTGSGQPCHPLRKSSNLWPRPHRDLVADVLGIL